MSSLFLRWEGFGGGEDAVCVACVPEGLWRRFGVTVRKKGGEAYARRTGRIAERAWRIRRRRIASAPGLDEKASLYIMPSFCGVGDLACTDEGA